MAYLVAGRQPFAIITIIFINCKFERKFSMQWGVILIFGTANLQFGYQPIIRSSKTEINESLRRDGLLEFNPFKHPRKFIRI
jgi:hypothetical protein